MQDSLDIIDERYAGDQQAFWWPRATVTMTTVAKKAVLVIDGVKKQTSVTTLDTDYPLQPNAASPAPDNNAVTINSALLVPQDVMVFKLLNPRDFEQHWNAIDLAKQIMARELPPTAAAYIVSQVLRRAFQYLDQCLWIGSTEYQGKVAQNDVRYQYQYFNGYIQRMVNDANVISVGSVVTFTTANIIGFMQSCITQTSLLLKSNPDKWKRLKFVMNPNSFTLFAQAMTIGTTYKNLGYADATPNVFQGYEIVELYGVPDNTIVFGEFLNDGTGNFAIAINAYEDMELKLERYRPEDERWFVQGKMKMDVNYGWGNQIVLATTLTSASFIA